MILEQCKRVHCVDLGESFRKNSYLQNLALIQPRTSSPKLPRHRRWPRDSGPNASGGIHGPIWIRRPLRRPPKQRSCSAYGKLWRARSRLYRSQLLQLNMRSKALAEVYTMHSFAQFCTLKCLTNFAKAIANFLQNSKTKSENVRNLLAKF